MKDFSRSQAVTYAGKVVISRKRCCNDRPLKEVMLVYGLSNSINCNDLACPWSHYGTCERIKVKSYCKPFQVRYLYPPSERSETGGYYVFTCVCVCARTQSHWFEWAEWRNVFDSCVKSWEYFRTDNISLEMSFYWLSAVVVRFKIEVGLRRNVQKCNTISDGFSAHAAARRAWSDDVIIVGRHLLRTYITREVRM